MGAGLQLWGVNGPWQSNHATWSMLEFALGLYFILSILQLEYVFVCCLALPLSHCFHWLLFLFSQAEKFGGISAMQKYSHVESWSSVAGSLLINVVFHQGMGRITLVLSCVFGFVMPIDFTVSLFFPGLLLFLFIMKICSKISMLGLSILSHFVLICIVTFCDLWPQAQGTGKEVPEIVVWLQIPGLESCPSINLRFGQ